MSTGDAKTDGNGPTEEIPGRAATTDPAPPIPAKPAGGAESANAAGVEPAAKKAVDVTKPYALANLAALSVESPAGAGPAAAGATAPTEAADTAAAPAEAADTTAAPVAAGDTAASPAAAAAAEPPPAAAGEGGAHTADAGAEPAPAADGVAAPAAAAASVGAFGEERITEPVAAVGTNEALAEKAAALDEQPGIHVHLYGQTDVGLVREHNEDNFLLVDLTTNVRGVDDRLLRHTIGARGSLFVVCDGMGGAAAGEIASQMAVDTLHDIMTSGGTPENRDHFARRLVHAVEEAGSRIFSSAKMDRTRRGMGTTSTVAGVVDKILFVGQVGDSRAYALRGGKDFALITKDQSLVNQLIEAGQLTEEEAEAFEHSNIILQALGTAESVTVDLTFLELKRGDRVMLCSDGLSGLVHAEMIKDVLANVADPRACCATLIEMARAGGGHDNITVIVADFHGADLAPVDESSRVAYQQYPLPESNDPRASFPPRETGIKSGGPKPGSDVKGAVHARRDPDGEGSKLWMWFGVLLLLLVTAAIAYAIVVGSQGGTLGPDSDGTDGTEDTLAPVAVPGVGDAPAPAVEVRVVSDVRHGDLWIDGERRTSLNPSGTTLIELPPGAYALEARTVEGASAARASLTVVAGQPAELTLSMPAGSEEDEPEGVGGPIGGPIGGPNGAPVVPQNAIVAPVVLADADAGVRAVAPIPTADVASDAGRPRVIRRRDGGIAAGPAAAGGTKQGPAVQAPPPPPPGPVPDNPFGN